MSSHPPDPGAGDTIISIPKPGQLETLLHERAESDASANAQESRFKIRLANSEGRRSTASYLIQRRYP